MKTKGKRVVLAKRPSGSVQPDKIRVEEFDLPDPEASSLSDLPTYRSLSVALRLGVDSQRRERTCQISLNRGEE